MKTKKSPMANFVVMIILLSGGVITSCSPENTDSPGDSQPMYIEHLIADGFEGAIFLDTGDPDGDGDTDILGAAFRGNRVPGGKMTEMRISPEGRSARISGGPGMSFSRISTLTATWISWGRPFTETPSPGGRTPETEPFRIDPLPINFPGPMP